MIKGKLHSIESMGLVDGPGIRSVVFLQGCTLRCAYCHNPDTWCLSGGTEITPKEIVDKLERFKTYYDTSGGGVTFSGGDPLLQPDFLIETLKLCKEKGIHTAIDTAGNGLGKYDEILKYTDLVLLDIKHVDDEGYLKLTGQSQYKFKEFLKALNISNSKVWIRHVVVPGITDSKEHILKLGDFIKENIKNVKKIELLPYHTLGIQKYEKLGIKYALEDVDAMDKDICNELQKLIREYTGIK
ncbi:pyruvate formate-lyase-activating protein [Haloimpatiens massiliensis]|uniref:pyruvate formate-lyase-activating protein n=1 Tax=Haloimpatiens massiliensis TaxID=1658110 RepID=UPI000C81B4FA|nr:pyruvate formate-lyase-activating protein [Haloimpatiens massiliensis]